MNLPSEDVYLPGNLIFEPVPYFDHSAASFLRDHVVWRLKSAYEIVVYPYCLFSRISKVELNDSSAMRTLYKLLGFQADPVEFELLLTMWT